MWAGVCKPRLNVCCSGYMTASVYTQVIIFHISTNCSKTSENYYYYFIIILSSYIISLSYYYYYFD